MARKPNPQAIRDRAARTAAVMSAPGGAPAPAAKKTSFVQALANAPRFFREVRAEARKITWTSRSETWITSVMVFIMVVLAALFFFATDSGLGWVVAQVLKFANAG
jgi:preprotein translocase subunit SecE